MMKALVKRKPVKGYELLDVPKPEVGAGEILIKVDAVAICGSDIPLYEWNEVGQQIAEIPFTPGHECTGLIVAIGAGVDPVQFPMGARVCAETHIACGGCWQCTKGRRPGLCDEMGLFGHGKGTRYGGCAQYTILEPRFTYVLQHQALPARLAAVLEPFGVAHHAVEETDVAGQCVLVLGAGPIGLFVASLARHVFGARHVCVSDVVESRLAIARQVGAHSTINVKTGSLDQLVDPVLDCVIECSGSTVALLDAVPRLRKRGKVTLVGLLKGALTFATPLPDLVFKCLTMTSVHGRKMWHTWRECESILFNRQVDLDPILDKAPLTLANMDSAIKSLQDGSACKIVLSIDH